MFIGFSSHQLLQKIKEKLPNLCIMFLVTSKQYRKMFYVFHFPIFYSHI
jgi:hypothetical protein